MARTKKKKPGKYGTQVQAESILRFSPERSTLKSALRAAGKDRSGAIAGARGAAEGAKMTADQVAPQFRKAYDESKGQVDSVLERLGVTSPDNAIARDGAGTTRRLAERLQMALDESSSRKLDADAGLAFSIDQANSRYATDSGRLRDRLSAISREEGAFRQARSGELSAADAERDFTAEQKGKDRANARKVAGVGKDGKVVPGGPKDIDGDGKPDSKGKGDGEDGKKWLSAKDHQTFRGEVSAAESAIKEAIAAAKAAGKLPANRKAQRQAIANAVRKGTPDISVSQPGENDTKTSTKIPGQKPITNDLALKIALDLVYEHKVQPGYVKLLHANQYSLKILGLPYAKAGGKAKAPAYKGPDQPGAHGDTKSDSPGAKASHVTVKPHTRRRPKRRK